MTQPQQRPQEVITVHYQDDGSRVLTDVSGNRITLPSHLSARDNPQRGIGFQRPLADIELQNGTHVRVPQHVVENAILHRPLAEPIHTPNQMREAFASLPRSFQELGERARDTLSAVTETMRDVYINKEREISAPSGIIAQLARTGGREGR